MTEYLEFETNSGTVRLCFTRICEQDNWSCELTDETLKDLQIINHKDL